MNRELPTLFSERMKTMLQDEYERFVDCFSNQTYLGLRVNTCKTTPDELRGEIRLLEPVPWCSETGFYYPEEERPGKHPYHAAGLYYLQEPSAMSAAVVLEAQPGETVLDLCAAPGGKSTQLAVAMNNRGLLISNEIHPVRVKALSENIERLGITNTIVTNETPERLAERFPLFFDRILVDAPCSGEGMFRKLPEAIDDWSPAKVTECHIMQKDILDSAADMLKPGGVLVYSTCTFAPLENEQSISEFLQKHPEFELEPIPTAEFFLPGVPEWGDPTFNLKLTSRLWPHHLHGEGHYVAKLRKKDLTALDEDDDSLSAAPASKKAGKKKSGQTQVNAGRKEAIAAWRQFAEEAVPSVLERTADDKAYQLFGEHLYYSPASSLELSGLKVARPGWHLGTVKKNRFEPSHALALAIGPDEATRVHQMDLAEGTAVYDYLEGQTLQADGSNGWTLVTVNGYPLGWGKQSNGQLKNHYPKGLRWV
ncbi:RsmF rRNA methyltransferase first C-terminal domain-containing protein [Brevibacillus dissolubilis]|uniref:RsmF rRNA methyltransferase first C-terminal domain-containing protein n=1 Tax=Brevibacillus dissolubilis TaxID=1844116 RepID=UPI0011163530|nr:RsmB/NOP family class I SAM-dependent RNA methyltransferase [Brevibacillus dissolubilis]